MEAAVLHLEEPGDGLHDRGSPAGVPEHRLGGVELHLVCVCAEGLLDGPDLFQISAWSARGVTACKVDFRRLRARGSKQLADESRLDPCGGRGQMTSVGIRPHAQHFAMDPRAAAQRMPQFFQHQRPRAVGVDKPGAVGIERS